jgi:hypothetical protein
MDEVALIVGSSWIAVALLTIGLAIPLWQGKIRRNAFYGMRFSQSFASDEAWYAINRYGAKRMILWAPMLLAVGLITLLLPLGTHPGLTLFLGFAPLVFVTAPVIAAWRFARRYGNDV